MASITRVFNYGSATVYVEADVQGPGDSAHGAPLGNIEDVGLPNQALQAVSSVRCWLEIGDINQDGFEDVLISGGLTAYLLYGQSGKYDGPLSAASPVGASIAELSVSSGSNAPVSGLGDFNGDGIGDLLVGNPDASFGGFSSGGAYVVYGMPRRRSTSWLSRA